MASFAVPADATRRLTTDGRFFRRDGRRTFLRGVTYGPFGDVRAEARLEADFEAIAASGFNCVRVFTPPDERLVAVARAAGLSVFAGLAWESHVDFLGSRSGWRRIVDHCRAEVASRAGLDGLAGWFVANEIESGLVRWMGPGRVQRAIEALVAAVRDEDPGRLFAYASYPSTEFLSPRNADFVAFNVYLEMRASFSAYLDRLQVLAGDRPLVISEFGADAEALGEDGQAAILEWQVDEVAGAGGAGTFMFAWTDEWHRAGREVTGWSFGLTRRDHSPRPALAAVREAFARSAGREVAFPPGAGDPPPLVSVIVCTRDGASTLADCLHSLSSLRYPQFEVIVVDDGSGPAVAEVVSRFPGVRLVRQSPLGLGAARNRGAEEACGRLLAYTDDDCEVDEDWLRFAVASFGGAESAVAAVGGPNLAPEPEGLVEACVGSAPGAPAHVLLDDRRAEHLPGCNLVVRRDWFERIGGFRAVYEAAGDDVDFCWRLLDAGAEIRYAPAAVVWHRRRATVRAYCRQQAGYGRAEAILMRDHPGRFGRSGRARWAGIVYTSPGPLSVLEGATCIYHGAFGAAPFQFVYGGASRSIGAPFTSIGWWVGGGLAIVTGVAASRPGVTLAGVALLAASVGAALHEAWQLGLRGRWDRPAARLVLAWLHLLQPLVRGGARWWHRLLSSGRPAAPGEPASRPRPIGDDRRHREAPFRGPVRSPGVPLPGLRTAYWNAEGVGREFLLEGMPAAGREHGGGRRVPAVDGSGHDDFRWRASPWVELGWISATEYHGDGGCLTRVRVVPRMRLLPVLGGPVLWGGLALGAAAVLGGAGGGAAAAAAVSGGVLAAGLVAGHAYRAATGLLALTNRVAGDRGVDDGSTAGRRAGGAPSHP